jgi:hypothetical protein
MKLEKREVALNEKDSILDMLLFEEHLQASYRRIAEKSVRKEENSVLIKAADELNEKLEMLRRLLKRTPKM